MDAPKCRSCGERHWGPLCSSPATKPARVVEVKTAIAKQPFDRKAYQRQYMKDYMRKLRGRAGGDN